MDFRLVKVNVGTVSGPFTPDNVLSCAEYVRYVRS